jgi:hypothetical protein
MQFPPIDIRQTNRVQTYGIGTARAAVAHGEEADEGVYERTAIIFWATRQ